MRNIIILIALLFLGVFGLYSQEVKDTTYKHTNESHGSVDEYKAAYRVMMKSDTTFASEKSICMLLNSQIPELVENYELSNKLVDKYIANNGSEIENAMIEVYKKYLSLDELKDLIRMEQDPKYVELGNKMAEALGVGKIISYVDSACQRMSENGILTPIPVNDLPEGYLEDYIKSLSLQQFKSLEDRTNFKAYIKLYYEAKGMDIDESQIEEINKHIRENYTRFAAKQLYHKGITKSDFNYLSKFSKNQAVAKRTNALLECTDHKVYVAMIKRATDSYIDFLSKEGYALSPVTKEGIRNKQVELENLLQN